MKECTASGSTEYPTPAVQYGVQYHPTRPTLRLPCAGIAGALCSGLWSCALCPVCLCSAIGRLQAQLGLQVPVLSCRLNSRQDSAILAAEPRWNIATDTVQHGIDLTCREGARPVCNSCANGSNSISPVSAAPSRRISVYTYERGLHPRGKEGQEEKKREKKKRRWSSMTVCVMAVCTGRHKVGRLLQTDCLARLF